MMNEISKYAKTLINDYAEEYQNYFEESNKNQSYFLGLRMELFGYIATLEAENEKLKAEAEKYEWKQGHPEHENIVNVLVKPFEDYGDVKPFYATNRWDLEAGEWFFDKYFVEVLAYAEIRPWKEQ